MQHSQDRNETNEIQNGIGKFRGERERDHGGKRDENRLAALRMFNPLACTRDTDTCLACCNVYN